ncbi:MAG: ferritin-like domain-containing protein [Polyangiaceae bacterium]|nr:ferritin-like domain-containing protein [Polyangiaceae bacterium]
MTTSFGAAPFEKRLPNAEPGATDNWALYDRFLDICEAHRWTMADVRKEIESVDPKALTADDRKVIDVVGEVAVVEGNAPSIVVNQLAIMLYDAEFSAWATYQVGEEAKHFHVIRHYCHRVGHPVSTQHTEASMVRLQKGYDPNDFVDEYGVILINLLGETLNVHLYQALAATANEPVLKSILARMAKDERRHQQWFAAYFRKRAAQSATFIPGALASLKQILRLNEPPTRGPQHHQGTGAKSYVVATNKLIEHGLATKVICRTVEEQWALLAECFGPALDIDPREFKFRQMARPTTPSV